MIPWPRIKDKVRKIESFAITKFRYVIAQFQRRRHRNFEENSPLLCVITGMENTGTTLLSQLLNAHPDVASGVECGLLLSEIYDFHRIHPFYDWLIGTRNHDWGLSQIDRKSLLKAMTYDEAFFF